MAATAIQDESHFHYAKELVVPDPSYRPTVPDVVAPSPQYGSVVLCHTQASLGMASNDPTLERNEDSLAIGHCSTDYQASSHGYVGRSVPNAR